MRRPLRICFALLTLVLVVSGPAGASVTADALTGNGAHDRLPASDGLDTDRTGELTPDDGMVQSVTYRFLPGESDTVEVQVDYRVGSDVNAIVLYPPDDATHVSSTALERRDAGHYYATDEVDEAAVTYRLDLGADTVDDHYGLGVATSEWAVVGGFPNTGYYSGDTNQWEYARGDRVEREIAIEGPGTVASRTAVMGEYAVHERAVEGQRLRLITPGDSEPVRPPERILDTLEFTARTLTVGARVDTVTSVYVPVDSSRVKGLAFSRRGDEQDVWLYEPGWSLDNSWVHEYVHTRQDFETSADLRWFVEGSANYYEKLFTLRAGGGDYDDFRDRLQSNTASGVLTEPDSWGGGTPYVRGQRVLAALDARIQVETNYTNSLQDVLRRVNEREGAVTLADFADDVEAVAGTNVDDWIEARVAGESTVSFTDDPYAYTNPTGEGDADADGLAAAAERANGTHPFRTDTDADGLGDAAELDRGTEPTLADTDADGLNDGPEVDLGTDPTASDTDADGLDDAAELDSETDPTVADTDEDGLSDGRETDLGTDPTLADSDSDGLADGAEDDRGTDPLARDTDDDGLSDGAEVDRGADPTVVDSDGDGLADGREVEIGTNPTTADTDGDGLLDTAEADGETDPRAADSDADGLADGREVELGTDPTVTDSDGDGLPDGQEATLGADPLATDTDDDGLGDGAEVDRGTDPTASDTDDDGLADDREVEIGTDPTTGDTDDDGYADARELSVGTDPTTGTGLAEFASARVTAAVPGGSATLLVVGLTLTAGLAGVVVRRQ